MSVTPLQPSSRAWKEMLLERQRGYNENTRALWEPIAGIGSG